MRLHLENRIDKKIITIIIVEGIRIIPLFRILDRYVKQIEYLFYNSVMCEKNGENQLNHDNYEIVPISSSNSTSRKVIKNIKTYLILYLKCMMKRAEDIYLKIVSICIKKLYQLLDNEMTSLIMK